MTPVLVFDIETVPDLVGLRRVHGVPAALSDDAVCEWAAQRRRAQSGSEVLQLQFQRVVAIACALRDAAGLRIWSLGERDDPEPRIADIELVGEDLGGPANPDGEPFWLARSLSPRPRA